MTKHVTGVIPLHNHARWIADSVGSVATQGYQNKRVVVVDDGSTDGGFERLRELLVSPAQVRFHGLPEDPAGVVGKWPNGVDVIVARYETARGPSFARNRGIELANGLGGTDLVALLDSDDLYEPCKLSKSVAQFERSPLIGAVYSDYDCLRPDGVRIREWKPPFSREALLRECVVNCDSVVSMDALKRVGLFDETLRVAEDYDLWLRVSEQFVICHLAEPLVTIRTGAHSSTATVPSETWRKCWTRVMEKVNERMNGSAN